MEQNENKANWFYPLLIAATFALSRLLFHSTGIRFDASGLDWYWQNLDIELLKTDLLRSLLYQHSQPPLFNLFLGIVLKLFPDSSTAVFAIIFKTLSLALYYMLFAVLRLLRFKRWTAYTAATLFMLMPGTVLYENWLFYTWPTAVALVFAAHRLLLFNKNGLLRDALLYLLAVTAICLTRSMFHLIYLIAAIIPLLWLATASRKRVGMAAGVAIMLVGGLFLKNLLLFGFFGSSSWMGMNLWKITPIGGKSELLADSPVAQVEPFSPISDYPATLRTVAVRFADIPALAEENRQNGKPNHNHIGYIAVSEEYKRKSIELITDDLPGYAYMVLKAWGVYIAPARSYPELNQTNINALKGLILITSPADARLLVPLGLILVLVGVSRHSSAWSRTKLRDEAAVFLLFCAGTVFYVAVLGNLMEHGENMRFRVQTDPLLYLAGCYACFRILPTLRSRPGRLSKEKREMD